MDATAASVPTAGKTWLVLTVLTTVSFFNYLDRMSVSILVVQIKRDLSLSDTQIGLVSGLSFALFYAVMGLPIARIADRYNKAIVLGVCVAVWSLATAFSGAATSFGMLLLARALVGVGEAGCVPASFAIIAQRFAIERRPFAISVFQSGFLLGSGLGMIGASYFGEVLGWRATVAIIGLAGLPVAVLVGLTLRGEPGRQAAGAPRTIVEDVKALLQRRSFVHALAALSLTTFGTAAVTQWLPTFMVRSFQAPLATAGTIVGICMGVGGLLGMISGGIVAGFLTKRDRRWDFWMCSIAYPAAGAVFLLAVLSSRIELAAVFSFVSIFILFTANGAGLSSVQRLAEPERRATANAVLIMVTAILGNGLGPVIVGFSSDHLQAAAGAEALRWSLAISTISFAWAAWHFLLAARADRGPVQ